MNTTPTTRIIFMGTPEFAVPSLAALHTAQATHNWQVVTVVSQPDRPAGRGNQLVASPVKQYALAQGMAVLQPERLRKTPEAIAALRALAPDLLIVAAYGLILPKSVLELPTFGALNVHASLLPAYRGASPISAAILDGQAQTGITLMLMDEGLDTGPALAQASLPIQAEDTTANYTPRLATVGAQLLLATLPRWLAGAIAPIPQHDLPGTPTIVRQLEKEAGRIDWSQPAATIERMTRAYAPWPSAYTTWQGEIFKIWRATVLPGHAAPGALVQTAQGIVVGTGEGLLLLHDVQPAGKKRMELRSFLNGAPGFVGGQLG